MADKLTAKEREEKTIDEITAVFQKYHTYPEVRVELPNGDLLITRRIAIKAKDETSKP